MTAKPSVETLGYSRMSLRDNDLRPGQGNFRKAVSLTPVVLSEGEAPPTPARSGGFTLIEMIGVLAVITILAAALVPVVIRQLDQAAWTKEIANLGAISNALTLQIVKSNSIPDQSKWAPTVANWVQWPINDITSNGRYHRRYYLIDPALSLPSAGGTGLPYTQTANLGLTGAPTSARVMIVSTIAGPNAPVASGVPSAASFNDIWNTPWNATPSTWTTFTGTGYDICIQRLNFTPMFYQLILVNRDPGSPNARFAINGTSSTTTNVPYGTNWNSYYIAGSVVSLYSTNIFATSYVLERNISFVYENGAWGGQIMDCLQCTNPPPTNLANFFSEVSSNFFYNTAGNAKAAKGAAQGAVVTDMADFMVDYTMLADTIPPFTVPAKDVNGGQTLNSVMTLLTNAVGSLGTDSGTNAGLLSH